MLTLGYKLTMLSRGAGLVNAKMAKWMKTDFWIASGFHPRGLLILHTSVRLRSQRIASRSCTGYYPCTDTPHQLGMRICHTLLLSAIPCSSYTCLQEFLVPVKFQPCSTWNECKNCAIAQTHTKNCIKKLHRR